MSQKIFAVKYQCQHPSCQVFCKKGELTLDNADFEELKTAYDEDELFKSPRGVCRMGYNQPFKIVSVSEESDAHDDAGAVEVDANDPVQILKAEHKKVLSKLDALEEQLRQRSVDGLWTATADLENEITLHSLKKEEQGLFPILVTKDPMAQAFIHIVHEDHKEFISLLHSFRCGLQENQILDGIVNSLVTNLKNHIKKEDDEFFTMVDETLTDKDRELLLERMNEIEKNFVPEKAGNRSDKTESPFLENRKTFDSEAAAVRAENCTDDWSCH
jgi:hemerythrin-like domain-containing protein